MKLNRTDQQRSKFINQSKFRTIPKIYILRVNLTDNLNITLPHATMVTNFQFKDVA